MKERAALFEPLGLVLLALSLAIALAPQFGASWSGRELWVILWGVLAYGAVVGLSLFCSRPRVTATPDVAVPDAAPLDLARWTEEALRNLRSPAALSSCRLLAAIPKTLAAQNDADSPAAATPLEQARLLRSILDAAMERLRLAAAVTSSGDTEGLQYVILHEEYVLGRPNTYIMTHHSIAESTFHRYRRQAIQALASELAAQEQLVTPVPRLSR